MAAKFFSLVLHSHIPYVLAHGNWPHGMDWLYEAAAESYLPLLDVLYRLREEGISPQINISFTPVLMDQLKNRSFVEGFRDYLKMKIEIAQQDQSYFGKTGNRKLLSLSFYWENWYQKLYQDLFDKYGGDIISAYRTLQDEEQIEILTSAATHSYFPLLSRDESIISQVRQGRNIYRRYFGREAKGFWLPECGYRPGYIWKPPFGKKEPYPRDGVDEILKKEGINYFFVDSPLLKGGEAKGVYIERFPALKLLWERFEKDYLPNQESSTDPYYPYLAYPSKVPFLARDEVSGQQVWSGKWGYPGDFSYLEFHKKHFPGGIRYWRITSNEADLGDKMPYEPQKIKERIEENSSHFVNMLLETLKGRKEGVIVALYDTELFGHWWFEGPEWLYLVLKKLSRNSIKPLVASKCLEAILPQKIISLPEGSWGKGGFHWIWLNEDTSWIWEKIYKIEEETQELSHIPSPKNKRVLKQFFREKFLLESSDWPFLISTWTAKDYAETRAAEHFERAMTLLNWLKRREGLSQEEQALLQTWEKEDNLFEEVISSDGNFI
jgi:1,4-alpha-glucan branching enzyme